MPIPHITVSPNKLIQSPQTFILPYVQQILTNTFRNCGMGPVEGNISTADVLQAKNSMLKVPDHP